ncbi:hypothetical protein J6590_053522 [Homalodisca vitripennis]|nr:hypothetical protein J6590_053522 [Homalodisca vitripennis]
MDDLGGRTLHSGTSTIYVHPSKNRKRSRQRLYPDLIKHGPTSACSITCSAKVNGQQRETQLEKRYLIAEQVSADVFLLQNTNRKRYKSELVLQFLRKMSFRNFNVEANKRNRKLLPFEKVVSFSFPSRTRTRRYSTLLFEHCAVESLQKLNHNRNR